MYAVRNRISWVALPSTLYLTQRYPTTHPHTSSSIIAAVRFSNCTTSQVGQNCFASVEAFLSFSATAFCCGWIGSAYGNSWITPLRTDSWRVGAAQICTEVIFLTSILVLVFPAVLKCRLRDYGNSLKPELHPQIEALLGVRVRGGACCCG